MMFGEDIGPGRRSVELKFTVLTARMLLQQLKRNRRHTAAADHIVGMRMSESVS